MSFGCSLLKLQVSYVCVNKSKFNFIVFSLIEPYVNTVLDYFRSCDMPPIIHRVHSHSESNTAHKKQLLSLVKYVIPNLSSPCSLSLSMIKNEHIPSFCRFNNHLVCSTKLDYDNCYKCFPKKALKRRRKEPLTLAKHSRQASRGQET